MRFVCFLLLLTSVAQADSQWDRRKGDCDQVFRSWRTTAVERMYRMLTSTGDGVERAMGQQIGPDLARRYRDVRNGFSSRLVSRHGCPK